MMHREYRLCDEFIFSVLHMCGGYICGWSFLL